MSLSYKIYPYNLQFAFEAGTSRGVLNEKKSWFIKLYDLQNPNVFGLGEVSVIQKLSIDSELITVELIAQQLDIFIANDFNLASISVQFPAIKFGIETAYLDFINGGKRILFNNEFSQGKSGIEINGLIWMGDKQLMLKRIGEKLEEGYTCLKLKIGAINFQDELDLLKNIRNQFSAKELTVRVDANGAFSASKALGKLNQLAEYHIHSIEQPIAVGQFEAMAELCKKSPIPIVLDEELIGIFGAENKINLLKTIQPPYIILKPSLVGGFVECLEWINIAESLDIQWWITSALESNIGLNAIAQFTAGFNNPLPQGLGTGQLYTNNILSPLEINKGYLFSNSLNYWDLSLFQ